jgi:hypothetical protein
MLDTTPYHQRPAKEIAQEVDCMRKIFANAVPPRSRVVYEAFGGIGATAAMLQQRFLGVQFRAFDIDAQCCEMYNKTVGGDSWCVQMDARAGLAKLNPVMGFGAVLDFNRFTLLDLTRREGLWKRELVEAVALRSADWIEITDSAVRYLATNWRRYGLDQNYLPGYVQKVGIEIERRWGYKLTDWANHSSATYMLYARNR